MGRPESSEHVVVVPDPSLRLPSVAVRDSGWSDGQLGGELERRLVSIEGAVGLAAVQIGIGVRAFVMWANRYDGGAAGSSDHGLVVVCDPVAVLSGGEDIAAEGCLSVPGQRRFVRRRERVSLRGRGSDSTPMVLELAGWEARVAQHELDHLEGRLILDTGRSSPARLPVGRDR